LYNSLGILGDASKIAHNWHSELVNHGPQGDHFYDGKYVTVLTSAIAEFYDCSRDTGYFQPSMAGGVAPEFWGNWMKEELARVCYLAFYPEIPEFSKEILLRTGEEVQFSGIYEPQVKDGCMNYLLSGTSAPLLWGDDGTEKKLSVTWRLLWQDNRYMDGNIPSEEEDYFPPEKNSTQPIRPTTSDETVSAVTGMLCPKSGIWAVSDDIYGRQYIAQGDKMPDFNDREVTWVWTSLN
jgi:hypothetical protein